MEENKSGNPNRGEREYEVGMDEAWKVNMKFMFDAWAANMKRTYDEMQAISLESWKSQQKYQEKVLSDAQSDTVAKRAISDQALQNAVTVANQIQQAAAENANALAKQMLAHNELARDRIWNVDEVATLVAKTGLQQDIIAAAAAAAVAAVLATIPQNKV